MGTASATPTDPTTAVVDESAAPALVAPAATPTTATLPLFGAPLTVDITAGPGGALASVAVNPADGLTATTLKPNKVVFVNEDGTAKVVVNARGGSQKIEARAGSLAEVSGPGGWSGDLFGTGVITTVGFDIAALSDGSPDIANITTSDPTAEIGFVEHETDDDGDGDQEAKVKIRFTDGTQSRTLSIKVEVETDDGTTRAKVKIALSNVKGVSLPAADVAGAHVWTGVLCDGTAAQIDYTVALDGSVSGVTATPEPDQLSAEGSKIHVRFATGERVKIRVRGDDGELKISVDEKIRCHDAPPPSVNTDVAPDATRPDDDDHDDDHQGDHERRRGGDDGDGRRDDGHRGDEDGGDRDGHRGGDDRDDD
ncbi:MAG: hypothetical protein AB7Q42_14955 [Acidimicrobiia bacterium]